MNIKNSLIEHINDNHDDFILYQTNKLNEKNISFHHFSCNFLKENNILSKLNTFKNYVFYFLISLAWIKYKKYKV